MPRWKKGERRTFTDKQYLEMATAYKKAGSFKGAARLCATKAGKQKYNDKTIAQEMERRGDYAPPNRPAKADVDMALAVLAANNGNWEKTAKDTGFNVKTIQAWDKLSKEAEPDGDPSIEESRMTLAQRVDKIVVNVTKNIERKLRQASLRDLIYATKELSAVRERLVGTGNSGVPKEMSREERLKAVAQLIGKVRSRGSLSIVPSAEDAETEDAQQKKHSAA